MIFEEAHEMVLPLLLVVGVMMYVMFWIEVSIQLMAVCRILSATLRIFER